MAWPPVTHQDVEDAIDGLQPAVLDLQQNVAGRLSDQSLRASYVRRRTAPPASLLRAAAPVTPTVLAGDDFTGTAGGSLAGRSGTLGTPSFWTVVSGTWQIDGAGHVSPTTATDGILAVLTPPARTQTNYTVSMDVVISKSGSQSNQGALVFRYVDTSNFWYYQPPVSGGTDWRLYKVVGGSHTVVLQFGLPAKANGTTVNLRADVWGRDITVYLDGAEIYTATDTAGQSASTVGIRQGISGGYTTPIVVSNFKVTTYAGAKFNIPRLDAAAAQQLFPNGAVATWDASDDNNPNVTWDPVNHRWVLYYSGYTSATGTPTIQGMGLAYANSLDGPWTPDPANPVVPATTGNIENGGLVYVAGRWLRIEDIGGGAYTSPDLHTWTPLTMYGFPTNAGDPYLRVNENGLLECWYGVGIPATQIWRATSSDGGITWDVPTAPVINVPSYLTLRGHGEPSVYVPPGKEPSPTPAPPDGPRRTSPVRWGPSFGVYAGRAAPAAGAGLPVRGPRIASEASRRATFAARIAAATSSTSSRSMRSSASYLRGHTHGCGAGPSYRGGVRRIRT
jgi:hypothetical protein